MRTNQVIALIDRWKWVAHMSLPPPISSTTYRLSQATPRPVRTGALRGRSRMWCSRPSPVIHASTKGYTAMASRISGKSDEGMKTPSSRVWPQALISQPGITRIRPSEKPRYQSGWAPVDTRSGRYGPIRPDGLMVATAPSTASTPNTRKKKPPAFAM